MLEKKVGKIFVTRVQPRFMRKLTGKAPLSQYLLSGILQVSPGLSFRLRESFFAARVVAACAGCFAPRES